MKDKIFEKIKEQLEGVESNVLLKNYTSYKIGGPAKYFFSAKTKEDLVKALETAKNFSQPVFILGGGSNILFSDKGFNGLVIKIGISDVIIKGTSVVAGAGVELTKTAHLLAEKGLSGLEWSAGIPGTIGGAVYGHAQAFGGKISDSIEFVEALDINTLKVEKLSKKQCAFSVKNSVFKKNKNLVIVSADLRFFKKSPVEIKKQIAKNLDYRKTNHPLDLPSAGSTFVNPKSAPAGYLISKCGLSGRKIGKAKISEKHANFIVNMGGAKAKDVLALMGLAQKKVKEKFGIKLDPEVQILL